MKPEELFDESDKEDEEEDDDEDRDEVDAKKSNDLQGTQESK